MRPEWRGRSLNELLADRSLDPTEVLAEWEPDTVEDLVAFGAQYAELLKSQLLATALHHLGPSSMGDLTPIELRGFAAWLRSGALRDPVADDAAALLEAELDRRMQEYRR